MAVFPVLCVQWSGRISQNKGFFNQIFGYTAIFHLTRQFSGLKGVSQKSLPALPFPKGGDMVSPFEKGGLRGISGVFLAILEHFTKG